MKLRPGVTISTAIEQVKRAIANADTVKNALGNLHANGYQTVSARPDFQQVQHSYLYWAESSVEGLGQVFSDTELIDSILGVAYWNIAGYQGSVSILSRLIDEELIRQVGRYGVPNDPSHSRLGEAVKELEQLLSLSDRPGSICVPDTNALMHYTRFDQMLWPQRLGLDSVRLVIPLAVVVEIDNKKYARRGEFWDRARDLLALIDGYADGSPDGYAAVREGVTVEILSDEPGHVRLGDTDQEVLDRCDLLHAATGQPVTLITGDSAARIYARVNGHQVFKLSRDDLLARYKPELEQATPDAQ